MKVSSAVFAAVILLSGCHRTFPDTLPGAEIIDGYVALFNDDDNELYAEAIPNEAADEFLRKNIPVFECPDKEFEKTYYFRWWVFRKHLRHTDNGWVITEFLPDVFWAGPHNTINCPAMMHISEGRWLRDKSIVRDYVRFWSTPDSGVRNYSFPFAWSLLQYWTVTRDSESMEEMYGFSKENFAEWEKERLDSTGLFWQTDLRDGMECSISGRMAGDWRGYRPTINAYMYADAKSIAKMARLLGKAEDADRYEARALRIKAMTDSLLWNEKDRFYEAIPLNRDFSLSGVRELCGYVPWEYDLPDADKTVAWGQLMDPEGFFAPFGPTTAEQRAEGFAVRHEPDTAGFRAQWNGPSWPFATTQTLHALANVLRRFPDNGTITREDYFKTFKIYSDSHRLSDGQGKEVCWLDENLDPFTGEWILREINLDSGDTAQSGKDYNHSAFADLLITGLLGIMPQEDGSIIIDPLVPDDAWPWWSISGVSCCGKELTVVYDKDGSRYGCGKGLHVWTDSKKAAHANRVRP